MAHSRQNLLREGRGHLALTVFLKDAPGTIVRSWLMIA
jgi:hypothetical protein